MSGFSIWDIFTTRKKNWPPRYKNGNVNPNSWGPYQGLNFGPGAGNVGGSPTGGPGPASAGSNNVAPPSRRLFHQTPTPQEVAARPDRRLDPKWDATPNEWDLRSSLANAMSGGNQPRNRRNHSASPDPNNRSNASKAGGANPPYMGRRMYCLYSFGIVD